MLTLPCHPTSRVPLAATIAVPLMAAVLAGGIYLAASATASRVISTLSTTETLRHARAVEFDATLADRRQRIAIRGL